MGQTLVSKGIFGRGGSIFLYFRKKMYMEFCLLVKLETRPARGGTGLSCLFNCVES